MLKPLNLLQRLRLGLWGNPGRSDFLIAFDVRATDVYYTNNAGYRVLSHLGMHTDVKIKEFFASNTSLFQIGNKIYKSYLQAETGTLQAYGFFEATRLAYLEEFHSIMKNSLDPFWIIDEEGYLLDSNSTAATILGDPPVGKSLSLRFMNPEALEKALQDARAMDYSGDCDLMVFSALNENERHITVNIVKQEPSPGTPPRFLVSGRDVTDHIRDAQLYSLESSVYSDLALHKNLSDVTHNYCERLTTCLGAHHLVLFQPSELEGAPATVKVVHNGTIPIEELKQFDQFFDANVLRDTTNWPTLPRVMLTVENMAAKYAWGITLRAKKGPSGLLVVFKREGADRWLTHTMVRTAALLNFVMEHHTQQRRLKLLANIFEQNAEAIVLTDAQGLIVDYNEAFVSVTGYTNVSLYNNFASLYLTGFNEYLQDRLGEKHVHTEDLTFKRANGDVYPARLTLTAVSDPNPPHEKLYYVIQFRDISLEKQHMDDIKFMAHHDLLTGLANRQSLNTAINLAIKTAIPQQESFALLFMDLDRFKQINDTYGHQVGDALLVEVAKRLRAGTRHDSDLVARWGGDEFVIILHNIRKKEDVLTTAAKILNGITRTVFKLEGAPDLVVTPSIGIAIYPDNGLDLDVLMGNADKALYAAKNKGRNQVCLYDASMEQGLPE